MLINSGMPLDTPIANGMTAFQLAVYYGHTLIVELLIDFAASQGPRQKKKLVNQLNRQSSLSALSYAIINKKTNIAAILIQQGAMHYFSKSSLQKDLSPIFLCVNKGLLDLLDLMYQHNPELMEVKNSRGVTALMQAAETNEKQIVNYLSLRTSKLNIEDSQGRTLLMHMILQENFKMATRLLVRGATVDYVNRSGKTALHLCVETKNKNAIEYLLFKGANQHILDLNEEDCCDKAKSNGLALEMHNFLNCTLRKKVKPQLPKGIKVNYKYSEYYL